MHLFICTLQYQQNTLLYRGVYCCIVLYGVYKAV